MPFENRVDSFDLLGEHLWEAMEKSVTAVDDVDTIIDIMLQISGKINQNLHTIITHWNLYNFRFNLRNVSRYENCRKCITANWKSIDINSYDL